LLVEFQLRIRYGIFDQRQPQRLELLLKHEMRDYRALVLKIKQDLRAHYLQLEDAALDILKLSVN
jgi:hypothetical protein